MTARKNTTSPKTPTATVLQFARPCPPDELPALDIMAALRWSLKADLERNPPKGSKAKSTKALVRELPRRNHGANLFFPIATEPREARKADCRQALENAAILAIESGLPLCVVLEELDQVFVKVAMIAADNDIHLAAVMLDCDETFVRTQWQRLEKIAQP